MAVLFYDGFDHYTTPTQKWTSATSVTISSVGRNGTSGASTGNTGSSLVKVLSSAKQTLICGTGWRTAGFTAVGTVIAFDDSGTEQISVRWTTAAKLEVRIGGTVHATGATVLSTSTFYYIELKAKIDNSTGSYTLKIDGSTELTASGIDTQASGNASADRLRIAVGNNSFNSNWDDLYLLDDSGSAPLNDFLGDVRCTSLLPNGAGNYTQWTPSTGSNFQVVDETAPNDDTDYNSDSTVGHKDTYTFQDLTGTGTVYAVQSHLWARKDDAGTRQIAPLLRSGGSDNTGTTVSLSTSYAYYNQIYETNPITAAVWTVSDVNGLEAGAVVIA